MRRSARRHLLTLLAGLAALLTVLPAPARDGATGDDLDANRRLLERYRRDPERYARLKRDWRAFMTLPEERRDQLRRLDDDLHDDDGAQRLWVVLERYSAWLDRLPEVDRRRVEGAAGMSEKVRAVRELREREWVARLPAAVRQRVVTAEGAGRQQLIAELRQKERDRGAEWNKALRVRPGGVGPRPQPPRVPAVPLPRLRTFVDLELTPEDRERLLYTSLTDPVCRLRITQEYFARHPEELAQRQAAKKKKAEGK